jgi:hypothetical protein
MIDIYPNKVAITSSLFSTCGCILRVERCFSEDFPTLSLACGSPLGANGALSYEWQRLHELWVEDPSGARKGGANRPTEWARPAGLGRPAWADRPRPILGRFGSERDRGVRTMCGSKTGGWSQSSVMSD